MRSRRVESPRTEYRVCDRAGKLLAVHVRLDLPNGDKRIWWQPREGVLPPTARRLPDGVTLRDLPLYGSELVADYPGEFPLFITEGEKAADTITACGLPGLGTVTGASACPTPEAMRSVVMSRLVILWPDNDPAGWGHMLEVGESVRQAGATGVRVIAYRPMTEEARWPLAWDAADVLAGCAPEAARALVIRLAEEWAERVPRRRPESVAMPTAGSRPTSSRDRSVTAALAASYGIQAHPGQSIRCPVHDDRHASLSVLRDDERVICHAPGCEWSGRGAIAADIRSGVRA